MFECWIFNPSRFHLAPVILLRHTAKILATLMSSLRVEARGCLENCTWRTKSLPHSKNHLQVPGKAPFLRKAVYPVFAVGYLAQPWVCRQVADMPYLVFAHVRSTRVAHHIAATFAQVQIPYQVLHPPEPVRVPRYHRTPSKFVAGDTSDARFGGGVHSNTSRCISLPTAELNTLDFT